MRRICNECGNSYRKTNTYKNNNICKNCHLNKQYNGKYLYMVRGLNNTILYVGQTVNYYNRLNVHLSGESPNTKDIFKSNIWSDIIFIDVTKCIKHQEELLSLEQLLIEKYNPTYNDRTNGKFTSIDKLLEISYIMNNSNWKVFKYNTIAS